MTIQEKTEKLQAIVAEQKEILESKVGKDGIFDALRKLSRLKYLEVQKQMLMAIPAKRMLPDYAKGAIVGSNDKSEMIIENVSSTLQTSFRGITAEEFAKGLNDVAIKLKVSSLKSTDIGYSTDTEWYFKNAKPLPSTNSFRECLEQIKPAN